MVRATRATLFLAVTLALAVAVGAWRLSFIRPHRLLTADEERLADHRTLVLHNQRLVSFILKDVIRRPAGAFGRRKYSELFAEGVLGLSQAAGQYTGQARFSKYAYHFIRSRILRAMSELQAGGASHRDVLLYGRIRRAKYALAQKHGRMATLREVAAAVGMTESAVRGIIQRRQLQQQTAHVLDVAGATATPPHAGSLLDNLRDRSVLECALQETAGLTAFDKRVFRLRVGQDKSIDCVAELMCTSRETVRRSLLATAAKLRQR